MYIVLTTFFPHNNDMTQGGISKIVSLVRVGKMVKAAKDSYKRVYKADGSYHCPKIPVNKLRSKGEEYFQSCEITGSAEGNEKTPKI